MEKIIGSKDFIRERCVSFETAKTLKPIYNKICELAWYITEQVKPEYEDEYGEYYPHEIQDEFPNEYDEIVESVYGLHQFCSTNKDEYANLYTAPNIFDVILFLISEYNIHVSAYYDNEAGYWHWIYTTINVPNKKEYTVDSSEEYDTIIEALDKGINEVAKHCISCLNNNI